MRFSLFIPLALTLSIIAIQPVLADGSTVYVDSCSGCHGENGKGAEGMTGVPDFTSSPAIWAKGDDELVLSVIIGIEKPDAEVTMPPRAGDDELTDVQIKNAALYMRKSFAQ